MLLVQSTMFNVGVRAAPLPTEQEKDESKAYRRWAVRSLWPRGQL